MSTPDPTQAWTEAMQDLALLFIDLAVTDPQLNANPTHYRELYEDLYKLRKTLADEGDDMTDEINQVLRRMRRNPISPLLHHLDKPEQILNSLLHELDLDVPPKMVGDVGTATVPWQGKHYQIIVIEALPSSTT